MAIGAPYEDENKGAVYIYLGGGKDGGFFPHPENVYWQRIGASDFTAAGPLINLKGFGISLTAGDVDDNQYIGFKKICFDLGLPINLYEF